MTITTCQTGSVCCMLEKQCIYKPIKTERESEASPGSVITNLKRVLENVWGKLVYLGSSLKLYLLFWIYFISRNSLPFYYSNLVVYPQVKQFQNSTVISSRTFQQAGDLFLSPNFLSSYFIAVVDPDSLLMNNNCAKVWKLELNFSEECLLQETEQKSFRYLS